MDSDIERFPHDLSSPVWQDVVALLHSPEEMSTDRRRCASEVLLRLGYVGRAAELLGMTDATPAAFGFSPDNALEELQVFRRTRHDAHELEVCALRAATDDRLSSDIRMRLATFVVVRNGARGAHTAELQDAAKLACEAAKALESSEFAQSLARQTVFRAVAFVPFVQKDTAATWAALDQAMECQEAAHPTNNLESLAWVDHAFPLFQTIARTHLLLGDAHAAAIATERLVELSPNDQRTWDLRGQSLLAAGLLEESLTAYGRMAQIGGLPIARAAFYIGWIHQRLGRLSEARESYLLSRRVDPTAPAVHHALNQACFA